MKENTRSARTSNFSTRVVNHAGFAGGKPKRVLSQPSLGTFLSIIATLIATVPAFGSQEGSIGECLAREGATSIIHRQSRSRYEAKLCVTPDEVARYVFLTNRWDYGDRSAAVYRARRKKGSLPGDYWITATVAEDSTRGPRHRNVGVRRYDAPLPESVANVLHELWVTVIEKTPTVEDAIPCAPTAVFSATTNKGVRLRAVTVYLDEKSLCNPLLTLGGWLVDYGKLPTSQRGEAARKIEKESRRLLERVAKGK